MKKFLIVYATREGQTAKVADRIAQHLTSAGATVTLLDAADTSSVNGVALDSFDVLIFGASMHAGGLEKELVEFVVANEEQIQHARRSFFLVLLSAATKDPDLKEKTLQDARSKVAEQLPVTFPDTEMIAGALMYSRYSLPVRWIMKRIAKKAGGDTDTSRDYEYTDWNQVRQYAARLIGRRPQLAIHGQRGHEL